METERWQRNQRYRDGRKPGGKAGMWGKPGPMPWGREVEEGCGQEEEVVIHGFHSRQSQLLFGEVFTGH